MPLFDNLKSAWSALVGKSGPPPGSYGVGWGGGSGWSDGFKFRRAPSPAEMVEAYKSLCYVCANLNMNGVARTPLRLFATTKGGQHTPKCPTKSISRTAKIRLKSLTYARKAMANAQEVEEVTEHPLLDTVMKVSDDLDFVQLLSYTVLSLDVTGNAYWWPSMNGRLGMPEELWAMPPHLVFPQFQAGSMVPDHYQFGGMLYPKASLVRFRRLSMKNPYGQGYGPLQAAIEYARLEDVWVSTQDDMLSNGPRPSLLVSPKDEKGAIGEAEARRLEHEMNQKGRGGRAGGVFIFRSGAVAATPLSYSPADVGGMQIGAYDMERIANCFDVPVSMLKTEDVNRANAEAGLEQHARNAIEPRCKLIASTLTRWMHSLDSKGARGWDRLFWAFDSAVKEDAEAEADLHRKYVEMGLPLNVALTEAGYDKVEGGDVSFVASGLTTLENAVKPPEPPVLPGQEPKPGEEDGGADDEAEPAVPEEDDSPEEKAIAERLTKMITDLGSRVANLS